MLISIHHLEFKQNFENQCILLYQVRFSHIKGTSNIFISIWHKSIILNIFKVLQRYHFVDKDPYSQSCSWSFQWSWTESWTIKKAECQRIYTFKLWCQRKLVRVPWTARRSNQSILKEINAEYSLEGLKLKLQYFGHPMQRDTYWKRP